MSNGRRWVGSKVQYPALQGIGRKLYISEGEAEALSTPAIDCERVSSKDFSKMETLNTRECIDCKNCPSG